MNKIKILFLKNLLLLSALLTASCANQSTSSSVVTALQSANNERSHLTKPPKQILVGKWFVEDGTQVTLYSDGNFDMPTLGMVSSSGNQSIPKGMAMINAVLVNGKMKWEYDGNDSEGFLKLTFDNYNEGKSQSGLVKVNFVNDTKIITITGGKTEVLSKIN
jgi:hypothetical protein